LRTSARLPAAYVRQPEVDRKGQRHYVKGAAFELVPVEARRHQGCAMAKAKYEVTGYDKEGRKVFHLLVEAVNPTVAKLYATAHLQRSPDGAEAVRNAVKTVARVTADADT
jgi:hypothetical protein